MTNKLVIAIVLSFFLLACKREHKGLDSLVVRSSIDSIIASNTRMFPGGKKSAMFWQDRCFLSEQRKQWIYTDSIEKYCTKDDLIELYKHHDSPVIRMVAFHLLLKRHPKDAVRFAIEDIDDTDSLIVGRCDMICHESASSMRVSFIMLPHGVYNISVEDSIAVDYAVRHSRNKENIGYYQSTLSDEGDAE